MKRERLRTIADVVRSYAEHLECKSGDIATLASLGNPISEGIDLWAITQTYR